MTNNYDDYHYYLDESIFGEVIEPEDIFELFQSWYLILDMPVIEIITKL